MKGQKSAWASLLCALCCASIMLLSMFAMVGTILGVSIHSVSNVMMVFSFALLAWAHFRYWRNKCRTKLDTIILVATTLIVAGVSLWHLIGM